MSKKREIVVIDPTTGNSKIREVTAKQYEELFSKGKQANNIAIPVHTRIAHVFREEIVRYFIFSKEANGSSKGTAFLTAFGFEAKHTYMRAFVYLLSNRMLDKEDLHFEKMLKGVSTLAQTNNAGNPLSNQDLNNEFYSWAGAEKLRDEMELRVAAVRFLQFAWHVFWDEEFQEVLRLI